MLDKMVVPTHAKFLVTQEQSHNIQVKNFILNFIFKSITKSLRNSMTKSLRKTRYQISMY